jgi:hypothetical protein
VAKRERKWVWAIVAATVVVSAAVLALRATLFNRDDAQQACVAYLQSVMSETIDASAVTTTVPEPFFPSMMKKRFRTTCTYGDRKVAMESDPFGEWRVVSDSGLD